MKGVLFNVAEDVVDETVSEVAWDRALCAAHLDGVYTSLGDYPDQDLTRIVEALAARLDLSSDEVLRHVGVHGYRHLVQRQPDLVEGIGDLGALLHHLERVIHPEVAKLQPNAEPPSFSVRDDGPDRWLVEYRSRRHLCALADGLIRGAADEFGTPCTTTTLGCVAQGEPACTILVELSGGEP